MKLPPPPDAFSQPRQYACPQPTHCRLSSAQVRRPQLWQIHDLSRKSGCLWWAGGEGIEADEWLNAGIVGANEETAAVCGG